MGLTEIFNKVCSDLAEKQFKTETEKEVAQAIKFVHEAGKAGVGTMEECRRQLGYFDEDEKKDGNRAHAFRVKVVHPLRNFLTRTTFKFSEEESRTLWSNGPKTDEEKAQRQQINAMLPKLTRTRTTKELNLEGIIEL